MQPLISLLAQESRKLLEGHPVELHHELNRHTEQKKHIRHKNLKLSISEYILLVATPRNISIDLQDSYLPATTLTIDAVIQRENGSRQG